MGADLGVAAEFGINTDVNRKGKGVADGVWRAWIKISKSVGFSVGFGSVQIYNVQLKPAKCKCTVGQKGS